MGAIRRNKGGTLLVTTILLLLFVFPIPGETKVIGVGAIGMTVSDLDRSVAFFTRVLDFRKVSENEFSREEYDRLTGIFGARVRVARLQLGEETIELTEYLAPPGRPVPWDSRSNDRWFQHIAIVVRDMDAAYKRLNLFQVKPISTEPQRIPDWNKAAAGIRAFYFQDPDNHALELISFPPGKGDPRWRQETDALFLGIDHTAIAVGDTETSLRFYRDLMGLRVTGESLNYGTEQERLNHVFGSRVRITGLRAPKGPGIEFLEYLTPQGGRPNPEDARPNDLWHWHVTLLSDDAGDLFDRLVSGRARAVSSQVVEVTPLGLGARKGALVRDPDAHVLRLLEQ